jgi:hypothetical protein
MNLFLKGWVLSDRAITRKMTENLHRALRAMMQFSVFFSGVISITKQNKWI